MAASSFRWDQLALRACSSSGLCQVAHRALQIERTIAVQLCDRASAACLNVDHGRVSTEEINPHFADIRTPPGLTAYSTTNAWEVQDTALGSSCDSTTSCQFTHGRSPRQLSVSWSRYRTPVSSSE